MLFLIVNSLSLDEKRCRKTPADEMICAGDLSKAEGGFVKAVKSAGHLS